MSSSSDWFQDDSQLQLELQKQQRSYGHTPAIEGYDQLQELSRGGQGIVYTAIQRSTRRRVAIKVLLDGQLASAVSRLRFDREIDLVAGLRHPNIVTVYDSGVTATGQTYLVMAYVDGMPLDEVAGIKRISSPLSQAENSLLDVKRVLRLWAAICDGVNYAHQHGVIHRDLKPSNILLDAHDQPYILDFGLAKVESDELEDHLAVSTPTITGQFLGSVPWASPEQARGDHRAIDVRSDIYALGVICYQMLTGKFPYDVSGNIHTVLSNILADSPIKPSSLRSQIDNEVETILLKSLSKEPDRRYQTAGALATDIRRYLAGEPIEAKRDSAWYAVRKTLRRYQFAAWALAAGVVLSLVFAVTAWTLYQQTNAARLRAQAEAEDALVARQQEQLETQKATQIRMFLQEMLVSITPEKALGKDVTILLEVLGQASARVESELQDQPQVVVELDVIIGRVFQNLSRYEEAGHHLQRAYDICKQEYGATHDLTISVANNLGVLLTSAGKLEEAETTLRAALENSKRVRGEHSRSTLEVAGNLAVLLKQLSKLEEAESLFRTTIRATLEHFPDDALTLATLQNNLGTLLEGLHNPKEAEVLLRRTVEARSQLLGPDHPDTIRARANLAGVLTQLERFAEAETVTREVLTASRRVMGTDHDLTMTVTNTLGHLLYVRGRHEEAEVFFEEALDARMRNLGPEHPFTLVVMNNLGSCLQSQGKLEAAEKIMRRSVEIVERVHGAQNLTALIGMNNLSTVLNSQEKYLEAQELQARISKIAAAVLGPDNWQTALLQANHADTLRTLGKLEQAETQLLHSYGVLKTSLGQSHRQTRSVANMLAKLFEEAGQPEQAGKYKSLAAPPRVGEDAKQ